MLAAQTPGQEAALLRFNEIRAEMTDYSTGRVFYGWYIVAVGVALLVITQGLMSHAFGAYVVLLRGEFGWSATLVSSAVVFTRLEDGILGPIQGWLIDRFGPRTIMRVGLVMYGGGFMLFSQLHSPLVYILTFALLSTGANLGGFIALQVAVVNWFDARRATAIALLSVGLSFAGLSSSVVIVALGHFGWRPVAFGSGLLVLAVGLPLAQLVRHRPEEFGTVPDGVRSPAAIAHAQANPTAKQVDFTPREAMRTPAFWFLSLGHATGVLVVGAATVHLVPHLTNLGYSLGRSSFVVALIPLSMLGGRVIAVAVGDWGDKRIVAAVSMVGHVVAPLLLAFAQHYLMVVGFAVILGVSWATRGPVVQAMRADYFGRASFGTIMGFSSLVIMLGSIAGPLIPAWLVDMTGSYRMGFTVIAAIAALGCLFFMLSVRPAPPVRTALVHEGQTTLT